MYIPKLIKTEITHCIQCENAKNEYKHLSINIELTIQILKIPGRIYTTKMIKIILLNLYPYLIEIVSEITSV